MSITSLGHYDEMIEAYEWAKNAQDTINNLIEAIRNEGVAEATLIELESEIEYVVSQYKSSLVSEFKAECKVDELNEKLEQLKTLVNGEL